MLSIVLGTVVLIAGVGYVVRLIAGRRQHQAPALSDAAIREMERTGRLPDAPDDAPLDRDAIEAAEEEFWAEEWDEPDEYGR